MSTSGKQLLAIKKYLLLTVTKFGLFWKLPPQPMILMKKDFKTINQAWFYQVKGGPTLFLTSSILWCHLHIFLDILELEIENKKIV